jgi:uncharacterized membrane protein
MTVIYLIDAIITVICNRILEKNDWRILLVFIIVTALFAGIRTTLISCIVTLVFFVILDRGAIAEIKRAYRQIKEHNENQ